ncbi:thiamine pyrophosphate-binding protein [Sphingomonas sp.]|uniref:thiamine pyrophosphate-binding protein n=1 Tax=Sphingomonas sp. TaxID=28214 RepID=UPI002DD6A1B3|nr:thiamine pyrophosphate-binding protein [Sphingomonas sp.]
MENGAGRTGGDLVAETLKQAGVDRAFVLHGGHLESLFHGCIDQDIELIDFRHEASAGHAADAYARLTGKLGVCIVTAGPGFTNVLSAISNANLDGSPVLFIVGASPTRERETNELQGGFDQLAVARPLAKWATTVLVTERMADITAMAIRQAMTGRKGAVLLELPIDVLHLPAPARSTAGFGATLRVKSAPTTSQVNGLLDLLQQAERPVVIAGMEAGFSGEADLVRAFAETTRTPIVFKPAAEGLLHHAHPLHAGPTGVLGALTASGRPRPDVVVLLGARMGMWLGGRSGAMVPADARVAQICADPTEMGRIRDIDVAIGADINETLAAATAAAKGRDWAARDPWIDELRNARTIARGDWGDGELPDGLHPFHAAHAAVAAAGPDAVFALDGGEANSWAREALRMTGSHRVAAPGYLGCLGIGQGFAIGAQIAYPDRRVMLLTGDGAFGFNIQELDTMVQKRLPVVSVVLNNKMWGMSLHGQQIMYGPNYSAVSRLGDTRYADIARAFGCFSARISRQEDIAPAVEEAYASGLPGVIELMLADVVNPRTVQALGKTDDPSLITIPYYENVPVNPYA